MFVLWILKLHVRTRINGKNLINKSTPSWFLLLLLSHFSRVRLCDPIDGSPPDSPVPGILQARTLEWVAISFSNAWKWKVKVKSFSRVWFLATPWTGAYQAPPSMGFFQARVLEWGAIAFSAKLISGFKIILINTQAGFIDWFDLLIDWKIDSKFHNWTQGM